MKTFKAGENCLLAMAYELRGTLVTAKPPQLQAPMPNNELTLEEVAVRLAEVVDEQPLGKEDIVDIVLNSGETTDFFDEAEYFKDEFNEGLVNDESLLGSVGDDGGDDGGNDNSSDDSSDDDDDDDYE